MPVTRTLLLPVVPDALDALLELEDPLLLALRNPLDPDASGVPVPGAPIEDVLRGVLAGARIELKR
ncbi:hypothetical protein [Streptomyces sp. NPDC091377]|uniref:hypothetical protein n=1 Tax=Streptomyces sp. NPDC091377 TaxID=3365995 RepID=UPI00383B63F7